MKDPAFLFYPGDWLGGTITFNRYAKGAYMDLLMCQFNQGPMTLEDIKNVLGTDFYLWNSRLKVKYKQDSLGRWYNERLEIEKNRRIRFIKSRSDNLHMSPHMECHMNPHMENENEIKTKQQKQFIKPTVQEIHDYCVEKDLAVDSDKFMDFYESKGWVVGKTGMKDWKAAVRNWARSDFNKGIIEHSDVPLQFRTKR